MAKMSQVIAGVTISAKTEGVEQAKQQVAGLVVVTDNLSKGALSLADAYNKQTLRLDAAARAQAQLAKEVKITDNYFRQTGGTLQEHATRLDLISQKYGLAATEVSKFGKAIQAAAVNSAQAINQRLNVTDTFASPARTQDIAAYGKALDDTRAKFNPLFAAGQQYKSTLTEINQAAMVGAISEKERAAAVMNTKVAFVEHVNTLNGATVANNNLGKATGEQAKAASRASYEWLNLGRQASDVGVSLQAGQSLLTVAIQQGTQIADVFATSQKTVGQFFSEGVGWAGRFFTSTAGIVTGIAAIGVAAVYVASQFIRASTTIEEALERQNRLLKEGKTLLDARASTEARAQLQSKEQTQFETLRNLIDLQLKLNKAMEEAAKLSERRATTPTEVPGEMGVAPTAFTARGGPGMAQMTAAFEKLKAAQDANLPGLKEYNAELAKIGLEAAKSNPALVQIIEDMIKVGEAGMEVERAAVRAKALSDALAGVATSAQLAAIGFESIAQFKLNNLQGGEAKASAERQAVATLAIRDAWGGVSIEAAKALDATSRQLQIAQAIGPMAQIEATHKARIAELSQKLSVSEATRIADYERAVSLAQIEVQHKQTMVALQGQLDVASQVTGIGQINAQYAATVASLTLQIGQTKAIEQAEMGRQIAIAGVNAEADRTLKALQEEGELIRASTDAEKDRIKARQTYNDLVAKGVDRSKASAVAGQQLANSTRQREEQEQKAAEQTIANIKTKEDAYRAYADGTLTWAAASYEAARANERIEESARYAAASMNEFVSSMWNATQAALLANSAFVPFATTWAGMGPTSLGTGGSKFTSNQGGISQFNPAGYASTRTGSDWKEQSLAAADQRYGKGNYDATLMPVGSGTNPTMAYRITPKASYFEQQARDREAEASARDQQRDQRAREQAETAYGGDVEAVKAGKTTTYTPTQAYFDKMQTKYAEGLYAQTGDASATASDIIGKSDLVNNNTQTQLSRLIDLMSEQDKIKTYQSEIEKLKAQPQTLARDELIKKLTSSMEQLTDATNGLKVSIDPLISQGHDYLNSLKIGYYQAATGLSGIVQGSGGTDSTPVHMMLTPGEHVQVTPPGQMIAANSNVATDNSKNVTQYITIRIDGGTTDVDRRTARQRAQGFIAAAARAAG
jgi:hypothetical protein